MRTIPFTGPLKEEHINNIIEWIAALRSGKYRQGKGSLNRLGSYCCLGVCSTIQGIKNEHEEFYFPHHDELIRLSLLPYEPWFTQTFGFDLSFEPVNLRNQNAFLYVINDSGVSFKHIADIIEASFINRVEIEIPI